MRRLPLSFPLPVGQSLCLGHPKLISSAIDCVGRRNQPSVKYDLPSGSRRLHQTTDGIDATIVNGVPIFIAGEPTVRVTSPDSCIWQARHGSDEGSSVCAQGELPGRLLRGPQSA